MSKTRDVRPLEIYDLPLTPGVTILHPEFVTLRFEHGRTIDVGALCYLERELPKLSRGRLRSIGRRVNLGTICNSRVAQVRQLIAQVSEEVEFSGRTAETLRDRYSRFLDFMQWADTTGRHDALEIESQVDNIFRDYVAHLHERVRRQDIKRNSGARQQIVVKIVLEAFHSVEDIDRGVNLLQPSQASKTSTLPPCELTQGRVLSISQSMFKGICDLILEKKPFPYPLRMPQGLNLHDNTLWLFPSISWFMAPPMLSVRHTLWCPAWAFNYAEGRLATLDELREVNTLPGLANFAGDSDTRRRSILRKAKIQLQAANQDIRHCQRLQIAHQAQNLFCNLFLAETGMNWAQVTNLPWSDDYEVSASHQAFRTVKCRAGGKVVTFELPTASLPVFKQYLAIRSYLLNGQPCDWLFFKQGSKGQGDAHSRRSCLKPTYNMFRRIDPTLPKITAREWRAAKSDWLIRNTDISTAALVLQNTERTVLASYAEGSATTHLEEMSAFLNEISRKVVAEGTYIEGGTPNSVGVCSCFGSPQAAVPTNIQPNCKAPEGCLFCDKFRIHADAQDSRKLLSCRYCLRKTSSLVGSEEQFAVQLGSLFNRIQQILDELTRVAPEMIKQVTREVDEEGELDPYWARKYEMLMALGVVS
ncbi:MAG: hypothetical protein WCK63_04900 [Betaproteobacteria bacterium]